MNVTYGIERVRWKSPPLQGGEFCETDTQGVALGCSPPRPWRDRTQRLGHFAYLARRTEGLSMLRVWRYEAETEMK